MAPQSTLTGKCVAEFLGTFLLVFTVGCNVLIGAPVFAGLSIASVLMVAIFSMGGISGGHFNPAVSVSQALVRIMGCTEGGMSAEECGYYAAVQVAGGVSGALAFRLLLHKGVPLGPGQGFRWFQAGFAEFLYTFMLCFVVLNVCASTRQTQGSKKKEYGALAIAFVVVAGAYAAGSISGGCFNPAVAIGLDASNLGSGFGGCLAYFAFELVGAVLAAVLFQVVRPDERRGLPLSPNMHPKIFSRLCSEFLGTYMLVLTVGLNVIGNSKAAAFSIAASLLSMIYALGDVSGAHFNPAVTAAVMLSGRSKDKPIDAAAYVGTQLLAGAAAAASYSAITRETFGLGPAAGFGWSDVMVAESLFTFVLCLTVLCVAVAMPEQHQDVFGLAIGACVTVGGFAIGGVSGGSLNPAVSFGIASSKLFKNGQFVAWIIYVCSQLVGSVLAASAFRFAHGAEARVK